MSIASSDYYIAGWWPKNEVLANKVMAISGELLGQPLFVYAGNPTNRQHPVHFFRWVTNAIFGSELATLKDYVPPKNPDRVVVPIYNQAEQKKVEQSHTTLPASPKVEKESGVVHPLSYQVGQSFQEEAKTPALPQTGDKSTAHFILSSFLLAVSGGFLLLKKKEVE